MKILDVMEYDPAVLRLLVSIQYVADPTLMTAQPAAPVVAIDWTWMNDVREVLRIQMEEYVSYTFNVESKLFANSNTAVFEETNDCTQAAPTVEMDWNEVNIDVVVLNL